MSEQHPEMVQVAAALAAYRAGQTVATRWRECGEVLTVEAFPEVGVLVVTCPHDCTHYRARWMPQECPKRVHVPLSTRSAWSTARHEKETRSTPGAL